MRTVTTGLFHVLLEIAGRSLASDQMDIISGVVYGARLQSRTIHHTPNPATQAQKRNMKKPCCKQVN
ncbi:hypothetical protein KDA_56870 [Dictyobacter alpinus]|uniref:Uncharacterized protein n=1 Tax=Dictyobacter alpinus TaxID=2014873 RepID=A0A402BFN2_9CHLR|nr:hypothetical protein KDA_56870 [Dictyobacter alpinus]